MSEPPPRADLGVEPPEVCADYCTAAADCLGVAETDCLLTCNADIDERGMVSADCAGDFEVARECAGQLDCTDFAAYDAARDDYPCAPDDRAADLSCSIGDDPPAEVCDGFCATTVECGASDADTCTVACAETRDSASETGESCLAAQEALLSCAAALDCSAFELWLEGAGDADCQAEGDSVAELCIGEE